MRHCILIGLLLLGACLFAVGQNGDTAKELIAMEDRYNDALIRADWKSLESILADDLIFNNADGSVSHKPDTINSLKSGEIKFDSIAVSEANVQDFGGGGVVIGKLVEKTRYKGSDLSGWHPFRRGLATNLHDLGTDDITVQHVLRHSNVSITRAAYIKTLPEQTVDAMEQFEQKWEKVASNLVQ